MKKLKNIQNTVLMYLTFIIISFLVFINYIYFNPLYYFLWGFDMHYYLSIADSAFNGMGFFDITNDLPNSVITPQNGVVFLHLLIMKIGIIGHESRMISIMIINYISILGSAFFIFKIFTHFRVDNYVKALVIGIFLCSTQFNKYLLQPTNDPIYIFLALVITYLVLLNHSESRIEVSFYILILSLIIPLFRFQGVLIFCAASFSYLIMKNHKRAIFYFLIFLISSLSIFLINTLIISDINNIDIILHRKTGNYSIFYFFNNLVNLFTYTLPSLITGIGEPIRKYYTYSSPFFLFFFFYFLFLFIRAIRKKEFIEIFINCIIFLNVILFLLLPGGYSRRYIIIVFPLIILISSLYVRINILRKILSIYIVYTIIMLNIMIFYWDVNYNQNKVNSENVKTYFMRNPSSVLISQDSRSSYFMFDKRSFDHFKGDYLNSDILIFGSRKFIESEISKISYKTGKAHHIHFLNEKWLFGTRGSKTTYEMAFIKGL